MCTLIAFYRMVPEHAVVVGMNRDEAYGRPSSPPNTIHAKNRILAPRDDKAGGTWVGMNEKGLVVALSNRRVGKRDTALRSRGLLVLEALNKDTAAEVGEWLAEDLEGHRYNPFNLFTADAESIHFHMYEEDLASVRGREGVNVLTNAGPNVDEKVDSAVQAMVRPADLANAHTSTEALKRLCSCHPKANLAADICKHGEKHGTVSSTIIAVNDTSPWASRFLYSDGCPCHNIYRSYSQQLREWYTD
jgi:uncharacterized protein with NRDE domain